VQLCPEALAVALAAAAAKSRSAGLPQLLLLLLREAGAWAVVVGQQCSSNSSSNSSSSLLLLLLLLGIKARQVWLRIHLPVLATRRARRLLLLLLPFGTLWVVRCLEGPVVLGAIRARVWAVLQVATGAGIAVEA
jgi:hypothetical protein